MMTKVGEYIHHQDPERLYDVAESIQRRNPKAYGEIQDKYGSITEVLVSSLKEAGIPIPQHMSAMFK
jgi:hypothetical protein